MNSTENYFCIGGAQRSGTTLLYHLLKKHPQICMAHPVRPEPRYFLRQPPMDLPDITKEFCHCSDRLWGEKSTSYIEHPECGHRMREIFPEAKVIFLLRNPVHRALSNYAFSVKNGLENRSLSEVFLEKIPPPTMSLKTSVDPFDYLGRGDYEGQLEAFLSIFSRASIFTGTFEELIQGQLTPKILEFLEVDDLEIPITKKVNEGTQGMDVPDEVMECLQNYFREKIQKLAGWVDISYWT